MTPKAYALCQLPLSLCADFLPPSEKKLNFFTEGLEGGRLYTGHSLLTNQLSIGWTFFKLATWRCLPKVSISKTVEIYHIKFLMCFTQGWTHMGLKNGERINGQLWYDKRIGKALSIVSLLYQVQRNTNTTRQTNPYPYHADYFGHKLLL